MIDALREPAMDTDNDLTWISQGIWQTRDGYIARAWMRSSSRYLGKYPTLEQAKAARATALMLVRTSDSMQTIMKRFAANPQRIDRPPTEAQLANAAEARLGFLKEQLNPDNPDAWTNIRKLLAYNPDTGAISRRHAPKELFLTLRAYNRWRNAAEHLHVAEDISARRRPDEPRRFLRLLDGNLRLPAERIAWGLGTGDITTADIGFVDGDAENLRLSNLFPITLDTD